MGKTTLVKPSGTSSSSSSAVSKKISMKKSSAVPLQPIAGQLRRAVNRLCLHLEEKKSSSSSSSVSDLLTCGQPEWLSLRFRLQYVNTVVKTRPLKIRLPTPLYRSEQHQICVIVKDPQRKWKDLFAKHSLNYKIIGFDKVTKRYNTIKLKKHFKDAFDIFFCDRKIAHKMPKTLGTDFIRCKKLPLSIQLQEDNVPICMESCLSCTYANVGKGQSITVRFARTDMTTEEMITNAQTACEKVFEFYSKDTSWRNNIFSVELFTHATCPLPVFVSPSLLAAQQYFLAEQDGGGGGGA
eukprot:GHVS01031342.1.p1 GENE.GHVS01031342.1~~GHVS01031342.1.p1  ORF type:complete len:296 (-),score=74.08 GHVS01031342.1:333-1220(-)